MNTVAFRSATERGEGTDLEKAVLGDVQLRAAHQHDLTQTTTGSTHVIRMREWQVLGQ
jgi:hypothetical protein